MDQYRTDDRPGYLITKYLREGLTDEEGRELDVWVRSSDERKRIFEELTTPSLMQKEYADVYEAQKASYEKIQLAIPEVQGVEEVRPKIAWMRWTAAAAVIAAISVGVYLYVDKKPVKEVAQTETKQSDIPAPVGDKTVLISGDKVIVLDQVENGVIADQGSSQVVKSDGTLTYRSAKASGEMVYNTLRTERGGYYKLVLPDRSIVHLNSGSSLRFPVAFTGKERKVELTGEAYFEVSHNAKMPFMVAVNDMNIQVLGTRFNVKAYNDEPTIATSLLQGSVKVNKGNAVSLLKPGQQAQLNKRGELTVSTQDVEMTIAWTRGYFEFNDQVDDIGSVMRQLSRWYNISDVQFAGDMGARHVGGRISKRENISKVLDLLQMTGVAHFEIQGNKVVVKP